MRKNQIAIFVVMLFVAVFLLAMMFIPLISAQEGIVVPARIVPEPVAQKGNTELVADVIPASLGRESLDLGFPTPKEKLGRSALSRGKTFGNDRKDRAQTSSFTLPYLESIPKPVPYPRSAIRHELEGKVVMALEILKDGSVGRSHMANSSGFAILDKAAMNAVKTWEFHPALKSDKPIVEYIEVPVSFELEGNGS
ncbi:MAG: hypothetical protein A3G33_04355 [Omnitrophica bacterium RIFCSPLOWO2_12_FULL_44_17]|uniref:TonB C-terminal domain-containing protein n=1 Tax=Candidatus Danuiimicrobium aquiferis TaxID=1801832 RepID=A0A1G1KQH0_9BACT|nr:MAG: hypothetical protein A3B72_10565 [Omnitrophica bacterium RIFCSPHIGHO2_02_FULL_45_28]OGW92457.1 MAG: hypothetical protein A3E74_03880 [Omnitrophica bacterium RIFCSPHIGHO2_12_FULL_44_12]OGW95167.1 MAG: hypothetical protein A3G33_04355 [Omnitrophica bacterium RIFCSPLOWO2_12_FULL_44_17]OGX01688.1 MAG: hypothetical protein A3J12_04080 [Omnitrophica bacterium RIFCSPLOWO2_02_FULL_44_11]